ncbi:MAG: hypothetical protein DHS20C11_22880 [Lysobacteraceae bacterium]|nr:MAG: hypothetical protein DHS20C11_22880 [Xanthomonadaceae bacterium]
MIRVVLRLGAIVFTMALWAFLVFTGTVNGWFRDAMAPVGDTQRFMDVAIEKLKAESTGNVVLTLLEDGKVFASFEQSAGRPVDTNTPFQSASLSKWITAWGVMALVDQGRIDLDAPIANYLTRWQLPTSPYDNNEVTVRRLLSHTAGLTDGLGYSGFDSAAQMQTLEASLANPNASSSDQDHSIVVGMPPGREFAYSGGGYTLLQLLIEEVSGERFESFMQHTVLDPLGMTDTTYTAFGDLTVADQYRMDGTISPHLHWTNTAAASIYTSSRDMTRFLLSHFEGEGAEPIGRGVLSPELVLAMQHPEAKLMGMGIWGMGPILQAPNNRGGYVLGGGGLRTDPAINADARINPATGNGIIVLQSGNRALASDLASEWTFWETGSLDLFMVRASGDAIGRTVLIGWGVIVGITFLWWMVRRRKQAT